LGLSILYGIVKQHEGWIEVESQPGRGSTFRLFFPVIDGARHTDRDGAQRPSPLPVRGKGESVLVVEDEEMVREFASNVLKENGYEVTESTNGTEALHLCKNAQKKIQLLLTDMVMVKSMAACWQINGKRPQPNPYVQAVGPCGPQPGVEEGWCLSLAFKPRGC
jgi:hypothetical protein